MGRPPRIAPTTAEYRYYSWKAGERGQFRFFEDPVKLEAEMLGVFSRPWASRTSTRRILKNSKESPKNDGVMTNSKPGSCFTGTYGR